LEQEIPLKNKLNVTWISSFLLPLPKTQRPVKYPPFHRESFFVTGTPPFKRQAFILFAWFLFGRHLWPKRPLHFIANRFSPLLFLYLFPGFYAGQLIYFSVDKYILIRHKGGNESFSILFF